LDWTNLLSEVHESGHLSLSESDLLSVPSDHTHHHEQINTEQETAKKNKEGKGRKRWRQLVERSLLSLSRLRVEEEWKRRETDRP
jgi:hypothetical protein